MIVTPRKDCYQLRKAGYQMAEACELCGSTENLVIDHITPLSQGGSNDLDNLRTLCNSCNAKEAWKYKERVKLSKYTTHLYPATIKAVKRYAFEHEMRDYEVVQQAIDTYLEGDPRIAALEAEIQKLQARLNMEERFRTDTEVRHFKSWLRKHQQPQDSDFFERFLADTRLPQRASRALYEARLRASGYSDEDVALFQSTWKDMLFMQEAHP